MSRTTGVAKPNPKAKIIELLNENRIMSVATVRPDGWPQATMVGYVHDDLTLYFAVARTSQKLANIKREPRISIALGHETPDRLRGLSIAADVAEVTDVVEIDRLNALILERYPAQRVFAPREASSAVLRAKPRLISIIDLPKSPGEPDLVEVGGDTTVHRVSNTATDRAGADQNGNAAGGARVIVHYVRPSAGKYRPGAPL